MCVRSHLDERRHGRHWRAAEHVVRKVNLADRAGARDRFGERRYRCRLHRTAAPANPNTPPNRRRVRVCASVRALWARSRSVRTASGYANTGGASLQPVRPKVDARQRRRRRNLRPPARMTVRWRTQAPAHAHTHLRAQRLHELCCEAIVMQVERRLCACVYARMSARRLWRLSSTMRCAVS